MATYLLYFAQQRIVKRNKQWGDLFCSCETKCLRECESKLFAYHDRGKILTNISIVILLLAHLSR